MTRELLEQIEGGASLLAWFDGRVPLFHDAEVLELVLLRNGATGSLKIHTFEMTPDLDRDGHSVLVKHVVVMFELEGITGLELAEFNQQNVIYGLTLTSRGVGSIRLSMEPCGGLAGWIESRTIRIVLLPGPPPDSMYAR